MTTYLIINAIFTGFLALCWKTSNWFNLLCKAGMALTSISSAFFAASMLGYIVKV